MLAQRLIKYYPVIFSIITRADVEPQLRLVIEKALQL